MSTMRILLIDDEEELVASIVERLGFRNIDAEYSTTGRDAIERVREEFFDVVVLDVKMPGLSGIKLLRELEKLRDGMRFIFLTGHGSEADYRDCCDAGACFYLVKPVDIDELISKLKEALA